MVFENGPLMFFSTAGLLRKGAESADKFTDGSGRKFYEAAMEADAFPIAANTWHFPQ
jgi:hypothetical protein